MAEGLIPDVLKAAWMILFLSLSSCEQRGNIATPFRGRKEGVRSPFTFYRRQPNCPHSSWL